MASSASKELEIGNAVVIKGGTGCSETLDGTEPYTTRASQLGVVVDILPLGEGECDVEVVFVNSPPDVPDMLVADIFFFHSRDVTRLPLAG